MQPNEIMLKTLKLETGKRQKKNKESYVPHPHRYTRPLDSRGVISPISCGAYANALDLFFDGYVLTSNSQS